MKSAANESPRTVFLRGGSNTVNTSVELLRSHSSLSQLRESEKVKKEKNASAKASFIPHVRARIL